MYSDSNIVNHVMNHNSGLYTVVGWFICSRDDKGVGVVRKIASPKKLASIFPDNNGTVLLRLKEASNHLKMLSKSCYRILQNFLLTN